MIFSRYQNFMKLYITTHTQYSRKRVQQPEKKLVKR